MSEAVVSHAAAVCATAGVVAPSKVQEWNHGKFLARSLDLPNFPAIWKGEMPNFLNRIDER